MLCVDGKRVAHFKESIIQVAKGLTERLHKTPDIRHEMIL